MQTRDRQGRHRVAITGIGVKTPAGNDVTTFWDTVKAGRGVAHTITLFDATDLPVRFACEVPDFQPEHYVGPKELRRLDRVTQMAVCAAVDALRDAGEVNVDPARCGVITGSGIGGMTTFEQQVIQFPEKGPSRVSPFLIPMMMPNAPAGAISIHLGWQGPNFNITTACTSSANAVGEAARLIRHGEADVMLAGGCEASVTLVGMSSFARMGALSTRNDEPEIASRPFDAQRDGFVMGEGAVFLILETWEHAAARDAEIYGELLGYGRNADAHHITAPAPSGVGAAACMEDALADAELEPSEIGHINAHGTSTPLNDSAEAEAIVKVFAGNTPPVTGTKGVTGHMIGAAGATEAVISVLAIRDGIAPPTANFSEMDGNFELDIVHTDPRETGHKPVLSNSFGFGGHNGTLVLGPAA